MYHARQMALLSRILSLHCSFRPLKFFHFGDTSFPLKGKKKKKEKLSSSSENERQLESAPQSSRTPKFWIHPFQATGET